MVLNKYVWNNYLKAGGADVVEMFHQNLTEKYTKNYAAEIRRMVSKYCPMERTLDEIQERLIQLYDYVNSDDFPTPVAVSEDVQREESDSDNSSEYDEILTVLSDEYDGISELLEQRHNVKATPQRVFEWSIYDMPGDSTAFAILYP